MASQDVIKDPLLVVAIDFGTTFSGYAFQFKHEYSKEDPTNKISAPQAWNDGKMQVASMKTPTCLLLKNDGEIESFGYEAERRFSEICEDEDENPKDWYFFKRFKMKLHDLKVLSASTLIVDEQNKEFPAIEVFSKSILCLKTKLLDELKRKKTLVQIGDILFVLTVPAIWSDNAKDFMRQAARKAGIDDNKLLISLEPESASLFCQYLPVDRFTIGGEAQCALAAPGTVYMIVDLGGGTADITVHEKLENGKLREVHRACGGPWGGTAVDAFFIQVLSNIVSPLGMSEFMREHCGDYLDLMQEFEVIKRKVDTPSNKTFNIKVPVTLTDVSVKHLNKSFAEAVDSSMYAGVMKVTGDKLKMDSTEAKDLFQKVVDKVTIQMQKCIDDVSRLTSGRAISLILMVGGFSESLFVQQTIKNRFEGVNGITVLIPEEAGLAVLKGAVIFGRQPESIMSRILRYTYGAEITPPFDPKIHDESLKTADGKRCNKVFRAFIEKGTEVCHGRPLENIYHTTTPFQKSIKLKIFSTENDSKIKYTTDEGCNFVGNLEMKINPTKELQDLKVEYVFGGTELSVIGTEVKSKTRCETTISMNN
ncbi:heat shock 70 kDa protein 12B-like [Ruditapes philippinarum]|uniref:heat shock 70 kDa protein 12B-like n=1 Tax=Ruditapes philippinarum TaxID=129788 RepID=UPI00295B428F|nr:heat shock 70 kDa protein 12B-like [Ruditapes philippinarum]XP_060600211.1 heat shock 70 kDa protein 12B-like [Ruditapes philippinarum]